MTILRKCLNIGNKLRLIIRLKQSPNLRFKLLELKTSSFLTSVFHYRIVFNIAMRKIICKVNKNAEWSSD